MSYITRIIFSTIFLLALQGAFAQSTVPVKIEPKAEAKAEQIEAGEPRAHTSSVDLQMTTTSQAAPSNVTPKSAAVATSAAPMVRKGSKSTKNADRIELDTTTVTGNRELPKVMYVVPWKKADIGDLMGRPLNSLLDEVLAPVDRDVFRREVAYYKGMAASAAQNGK